MIRRSAIGVARVCALACLGWLASVGAVRAQSCQVVYDFIWRAQHASTQASLIGLVQGLEAGVGASLTTSNNLLVSAVKVFTKQVDTSGRRVATNKVSTNQALATAVMQQKRNLLVAKAQEDYGIDTGQGVSACKTVALMNGVNSALEDRSSTIAQATAALDVAPGSAKTLAEAVKYRLDNTANTNAAVFFDTSASDDVKTAVIAQMAGLPPPKPGANVGGAESELMMLRARRVEALRSPALASLAAVATLSSRESHGGTNWPVGLTGAYGEDASAMEALDSLVAQYGGGSDYETWSAGLAGQSEHGLLIELTRLRAMTMKLRQMETEQKARLTANFAALLALETGGL